MHPPQPPLPRPRALRLALLLCLALALAAPQGARAEARPFIQLTHGAAPLPGTGTTPGGTRAARGGSLFAGKAPGALLAPYPQRTVRVRPPAPMPGGGGISSWQATQIRHLIAKAEAGRAGYDAVQHGARIKPPAPPTQLTIAQVYAWIKATPGQNHAIGRYQFIPATLRRLVIQQKLPLTARFSPQIQDRLADALLFEAGLARLRQGKIDRTAFMHNLARIWAGLPTASGKSHYHGHAGNKATMTWAAYRREMARIFPG